jgi:transposase
MKKGVTFMEEEVRRYGMIAALLDGTMKNRDGASVLRLSVRQVKRIKKRVRNDGPTGVRHGNRDRPSSRAFPAGVKERVMALAREKYFDFNFSHLSEMLNEQEKITVSRETLRKWLRPEGFGGKVRKQRKTEETKETVGEGRPYALPRWFSPSVVRAEKEYPAFGH